MEFDNDNAYWETFKLVAAGFFDHESARIQRTILWHLRLESRMLPPLD
jgi:hypothetical protein